MIDKIKTLWGYIHVRILDWRQDSTFLFQYKKMKAKQERWYSKSHIIRHAGGEINGQFYTNSCEALEQSLRQGNYLIEMDFSLTQDGYVVLSHDNLVEKGVMYEDFMNGSKQGITVMDLNILLEYLYQNKNLYIIFDCKYNQQMEILKLLVEECSNKKELLNRFIIQFYYYCDLIQIKQISSFQNYLFTLYASELSIYNSRNIIKFCLKNGIDVVTMPKRWAKNKNSIRLFCKYGLKVWVHTVNDIEEAKKYHSLGVYGVYSDLLSNDINIIERE